MLQYGYWPDGEEETRESAKLLCAGSIPAPASKSSKGIAYGNGLFDEAVRIAPFVVVPGEDFD